ncbi:MAG: hypothetical protein ISR42_07405 [Acidimicrobiia bacterium]|nr:hypothetical protein [Acidimicrobiia bacterium]
MAELADRYATLNDSGVSAAGVAGAAAVVAGAAAVVAGAAAAVVGAAVVAAGAAAVVDGAASSSLPQAVATSAIAVTRASRATRQPLLFRLSFSRAI